MLKKGPDISKVISYERKTVAEKWIDDNWDYLVNIAEKDYVIKKGDEWYDEDEWDEYYDRLVREGKVVDVR